MPQGRSCNRFSSTISGPQCKRLFFHRILLTCRHSNVRGRRPEQDWNLVQVEWRRSFVPEPRPRLGQSPRSLRSRRRRRTHQRVHGLGPAPRGRWRSQLRVGGAAPSQCQRRRGLGKPRQCLQPNVGTFRWVVNSSHAEKLLFANLRVTLSGNRTKNLRYRQGVKKIALQPNPGPGLGYNALGTELEWSLFN
jgi:hypothetical protein